MENLPKDTKKSKMNHVLYRKIINLSFKTDIKLIYKF